VVLRWWYSGNSGVTVMLQWCYEKDGVVTGCKIVRGGKVYKTGKRL
jgi:hypothetical protein